MSKSPSFQFYPADWSTNVKLRRCSPAARGVWMDVLCALHDSDEYGVCRWPLADLARAAGASIKLLQELVDKGVLKGADQGAAPYVYTPRHAGRDGEPVTLVVSEEGPCWYCSRLVRDEWVRKRKGAGSRFSGKNEGAKCRQDAAPKSASKIEPKVTPKPPFGTRLGYGSSTSSSSSIEEEEKKRNPTDVGEELGEAFWANLQRQYPAVNIAEERLKICAWLAQRPRVRITPVLVLNWVKKAPPTQVPPPAGGAAENDGAVDQREKSLADSHRELMEWARKQREEKEAREAGESYAEETR